MNRICKTGLVMSLVLFSWVAFGHDGPHDAPGNVQPKVGGMPRMTEDGQFELKFKENKFFLHFFKNEAVKPSVEGVTLKAHGSTSSSKKPLDISFSAQGDHWEAELPKEWQADFKAKKLHRITLEIRPTVGKESHKLKYTVEPRR